MFIRPPILSASGPRETLKFEPPASDAPLAPQNDPTVMLIVEISRR